MKMTMGSATAAARRRKRAMYSFVLRGVSFHRSRPRSMNAVTKQWARISASRTRTVTALVVVVLVLVVAAMVLLVHSSSGEGAASAMVLSGDHAAMWRKNAVETCSATNETDSKTAMRAAADRTTPPRRLLANILKF